MRSFAVKFLVMLLILNLGPLASRSKSTENIVNLKYEIVDKETVRVTQGLPYKNDITLKEKCTIFIEGGLEDFGFIVGKGSVLPSLSDKLPGALITVKLEEGPKLVFFSFTRKGPDSKFPRGRWFKYNLLVRKGA